jgi:hypothetical protein
MIHDRWNLVQNKVAKFDSDLLPFLSMFGLCLGIDPSCLCWGASSSIWRSVALNYKSSFSLFANSILNWVSSWFLQYSMVNSIAKENRKIWVVLARDEYQTFAKNDERD